MMRRATVLMATAATSVIVTACLGTAAAPTSHEAPASVTSVIQADLGWQNPAAPAATAVQADLGWQNPAAPAATAVQVDLGWQTNPTTTSAPAATPSVA